MAQGEKTETAGGVQSSAEARRQRLAAALRSNLAKRKAQARGVAATAGPTDVDAGRGDGRPRE
jgi:hypothetical protein